VIYPNLKAEKTIKHVSRLISSKILNKINLIYKANFRIPKVINLIMTYKE
jgi:hypothetical protein